MNKEDIIKQAKTTNNPEIIELVLAFAESNPHTKGTAELYWSLFNNPNLSKEQRMQVIDNASFYSYDISNVLDELSKSNNDDTRKLVAEHPNCSREILELLAEDYNKAVRENVATNKNCPADILDILSEDLYEDVRVAVIRNKNCSTDTIVKLSDDNDSLVYYTVVEMLKNRDLTEDHLYKLADARSYAVKEFVARHENCPFDLLLTLAEDTLNNSYYTNVSDVACEILLSEDLDESLLKKLSKSNSEECRALVASHKNTPIDMLENLIDDYEYYVREAITRNPNCTVDILIQLIDNEEDYEADIIDAVCTALEDIDLSEDDLTKLAQCQDDKILEFVISSPLCTADILRQLYDNGCELVIEIATHSNCPIDLIIDILCADLFYDSPEEIYDVLKTKDLSEDDLEQLVLSDNKDNKLFVIKHKDCCIELLNILANDDDDYIRYEVAECPKCSEVILKKLSKDDEQYVSDTAIKRLKEL